MIGVVAAVATVLAAAPGPPTDPRVRQLVAAHGGGRSLADLTGLELVVAGTVDNPLQAQRFSPPYVGLPLHTTLRVDWRARRSAIDYHLVFPGGHTLDTRELVGDRVVELDRASKTYVVAESSSQYATAFRYHPLFLLQALAQPGATTESLGDTTFAGQPARRWTVQGPGLPAGLELYVATSTGLALGFSYPRPSPLARGARSVGRYLDYRRQDGWAVPGSLSIDWGTAPRSGIELKLVRQAINPVFAAGTFELPRDSRQVPAEDGTGPFVRQLGTDLYLIERLAGDEYNALVMVLDDYVAVMEAPLDPKAGAQLLALVGRIAPTRPLRYLVLSHAHSDHAGGLPAFLQANPIVIAPAGAVPWLERFVTAASPGAALRYEAVAPGATRVLADAHHRFEIVSMGDNPHSEDLLVVHAPAQQLVFQADLLTVDHIQERSRPLNAGGLAFVRWLVARRWPIAIVAGAHGAVASAAEIDVLLARAGSALRLTDRH